MRAKRPLLSLGQFMFLVIFAIIGYETYVKRPVPPATGPKPAQTSNIANVQPVSEFDSWQKTKNREESSIIEQRPPDQRALFLIFNNGRSAIRAAHNEIVESKAEDAWQKRWCEVTKKLKTFSSWTGTVNEIRWNGYFSVEISFYPKDDGTLKLYDLDIKEGTAMFDIISNLKERMPVRVSGYFIEPDNGCFDGSRLRVQDINAHFTSATPIF